MKKLFFYCIANFEVDFISFVDECVLYVVFLAHVFNVKYISPSM